MVYEDNNTITGVLPVYAAMRNAQPYYGRFFTEEDNRLVSGGRSCF